MRYVSCLILILLSNMAPAGQEQTFNDNLAWAKNLSPQKKQIDVEDYCADNDPSCKMKVHKPDQVGMTDAQIDSRKMSSFIADPQANAVQDNFNKGRPTIDPNDETYRMALIGQDNAYEISHGISTAYADCDSGMTCTSDKYLKNCVMPTHTPVKCEKTASITAGNWNYGSKTFRTNDYLTSIEAIKISGIPKDTMSATITLVEALGFYESPTQILANGTYIGTISKRKTYTFPLSEQITKSGTIQLSSTGFAFLVQGSATVKWTAGTPTVTWTDSCTSILPTCTLISNKCIEGAQTKSVAGQSKYLSCWKYQKTYQCESDNTCVPDKPILSYTCKSILMGVCIEYNAVQEFENKICKENSLICGEVSFCLDGDCYEETPTQSQDFSQAASMLAAASEAAKDIGDPPLIFTGENMRCTIKAGGIANCCKDGGWGTDINITSCSSEEKALGAAQAEQLTIPLGSYCAEKVLGSCIRKKRSYCVFDSKLARIIQEQGKPQIGKNFGSAKNPNCSAITPEEMQRMDFSKIDFSDFYGDMQSNTNLPNNDEIKSRIQSAYGN